ncbi:MAG: hypothetical protein ACE5FW_01010, partial [Candidatus Aenigmatarchaeota archaeon]
MIDREKLIRELEFCLELWEKQGRCGFGGRTRCQECAAPYLTYKLITGKALHTMEGEKRMERLGLEDW